MGPLDGLKVLDVASLIAGPYGATLLGDMGAEVIKLEPPDGDESRRAGPGRDGESGTFIGVNRNKRSIAVDLRTAEGKAVLSRLTVWADVVVSNLRESAAARLGLDYASLSAVNPRIILINVSAYGEAGPYAGRPGIDHVAQALTGFMSVTGDTDGKPMRAGPPIADAATSILVAFGAMTALWARERTGAGQTVNLALIDAMIHVQPTLTSRFFLSGETPPRMGNSSDWHGPTDSFECSDGRYVQVACFNDRFFATFCKAIDQPELAENPSFLTGAARVVNRGELTASVSSFFKTRTRDEALAILNAGDVICGPVNDYAAAFADPQVVFNQMACEVDHASLGPIQVTGVPLRLSETPGSVRRAPPTLGQHTDEILQELGYSSNEIEQLISQGTVRNAIRQSDK